MLAAEPTLWDALLDVDRRRVWHPYGPMPAASAPLPVASASGVRLTLADGRELVDGMASWWCAIHGYRHPVIDAAVREQLDRMAHVMFGGLTHRGAIELAERLAAWTRLDHVFFADSGSVSVEVAIKLVLQYWGGERHKLLTWRGGYHGDTFGAMAVCDPVGGMHSLFAGTLAEHVFAPRPPDAWGEGWGDEGPPAPPPPAPRPPGGGAGRGGGAAGPVRPRHSRELAGAIVEPVVQGA